jgi:hypothetical protein
VSERERGVWRRYRLAPVPTGALVASTVAGRYVILLTAGLLQLVLAMAIGMPMPRHPFDLWVVYTFVSFAFLGLGLVIAMLADNVPAVQALGQCIFLPMLIIGGVAVRLASLPGWAQHLSAFFPGRYAVEALQACVTRDGLGSTGFDRLALVIIGAAGCLAGARMFRWEAQQRFSASEGKGWVAVALAAWVGVGLLAEARGHILVASPAPVAVAAPDTTAFAMAPVRATPPPVVASAPVTEKPDSAPTQAPVSAAAPAESAATASPAPPRPAPPKPVRAAPTKPPASWQEVTAGDIDDSLFRDLPPDEDVVAPVAAPGEVPYQDVQKQVDCIRAKLPDWGPARVSDPVQRVRNILYVAVVPDIYQMEMERWVPLAVFDRLKKDVPKDQLVKQLYWIVKHPGEGDLSAMDQLAGACLKTVAPTDVAQVRQRTAIYAAKLLGRLTGRIKPG